MIEIDASELRDLAADMRAVDGRLTRHIIPVLKRGAQNIKGEIQDNFRASGNRGFQAVARSVSYDLHEFSGFGGGEMFAEIGPEKPGGALANVAIFGTSRGGGTVPDPAGALANEAVNFGAALADLAEEIVW